VARPREWSPPHTAPNSIDADTRDAASRCNRGSREREIDLLPVSSGSGPIGFEQADGNQCMEERRGLSSIGSRRPRDLFRRKRPNLQRGKEVQLHTREHGEGGVDRVCQGFDRLRDDPRWVLMSLLAGASVTETQDSTVQRTPNCRPMSAWGPKADLKPRRFDVRSSPTADFHQGYG